MNSIDPRYNTVVVDYEREGRPYKVIRKCDDPVFFDMLADEEFVKSIKNLYLSKGAEILSIRRIEFSEVELLKAA